MSDNFSENKKGLGKFFHIIPPPLLLFMSVLSIQLGTGFAKTLFDQLDPIGVVALRIVFASIVLLIATRPKIKLLTPIQWKYVLIYGITIVFINITFYRAIELLPMGIVVTIEFLGPLLLSLKGSTRPIDFIWPILAFTGVVLLTPIGNTENINMIGLLWSFASAFGWALFIIVTSKTSSLFPKTDGLAIALTIAAIIMLPVGFFYSGSVNFNAELLISGFAVAILSTVIPFTLEFNALRKMPQKTYGIIVSTEPVVAALMGLLILGEFINIVGWLAILFVTVAVIGENLFSREIKR